jgi:AraC-like DNA-binding protein
MMLDVHNSGRVQSDRPDYLSDRLQTGTVMDPITDVFTAMRVQSVLYGRIEACAPWGFHAAAGPNACFGTLLRGSCWLSVSGIANQIALAGGDCFLIAPGRAYSIRDHPLSSTSDFAGIAAGQSGKIIHWGGSGPASTLIGGRFAFDETSSKPLMELLPPLIHMRADRVRTSALQITLQLLAEETAAPGAGSQLVVNRLADLLFIHSIRAYIKSDECSRTGWLRALSDPQIGIALRAIHEKLEHPWTVASLASEAGISRSAFALRFKDLVGEAPLEYLTRWRMYKASNLLRDRNVKLAGVADSVGYYSEGSFNKAFKRVLGMTPGEYRKSGLPIPTAH